MSRSVFYLLYRLPKKVLARFYKALNPIKFRLIGVRIGENAKIIGNVAVLMGVNSHITIGDNFTFSSGLSINPLSRNIQGCISAYPNTTIKIGDNVGLSSVCIWAYKSITVGNNVQVGSDTLIIDSDSHPLDYISRRNKSMDDIIHKAIVIEDDVWIGTRCIILKGVRIGARSIIGAGSIVTKDIPADSIAGGNPCRIIRKL